MSRRHFLNILLGLFLTALVVLIVIEPGKEQQQAKPTLTDLDPSSIEEITLVRASQETVQLRKQSGTWQIESPLNAPASPGRINKLLEILQAKSHSQYPLSEVDLKSLQLDSPRYQLKLNDVWLRLGITESLRQRRYVQIENTLHLIVDRYSHLLQGSVTDFVDSKLLSEGSEIRSITLPDFQLYKDNQNWRVKGLAQQPSADLLQEFLDYWKSARALHITRGTMEPGSQLITVEFDNLPEKLTLQLLRTDDEIVLLRSDLGLNYHLPISNGERLLNLPMPSSSQSK